MIAPAPQITPQWFKNVTAFLKEGELHQSICLKSFYAQGATYSVSIDSSRAKLELGQRVEIGIENTTSGATAILLASITQVKQKGQELEISVVFLSLNEHLPGKKSTIAPGPFLPCPTEYPPLAWADHPFFEKSRLQFYVKDFFKNGMTLLFMKETKTPIESLPLSFTLVLPGFNSLEVSAQVLNVNFAKSADAFSECQVEFIHPDPKVISLIGRYLFTTSLNLEVETLQSLGYDVPNFEEASFFSIAYTPKEIEEVMKLRFLAYSTREGANHAALLNPEQMKDLFDAHSLLMIVRVGKKIVGTGRLVFNNGEKDKSEIAQHVDLPKWFWKEGFIETSRVATVPGVRGRDVFSTLSRQAFRIAYQSGVRYLLADCESHLLEAYKRRGSKELGLTFVHPLEGKKLHVIYTDVNEIMTSLQKEHELWGRN